MAVVCPAAAPFGTAACSGSGECDYAEANGGRVACQCVGARWRCNSCPWATPPTQMVTCQASCSIQSADVNISCFCDAATRSGICCGTDAYDACPRKVVSGTLCCNPPQSAQCLQDASRPVDFQNRPCTCSFMDNRWHCM